MAPLYPPWTIQLKCSYPIPIWGIDGALLAALALSRKREKSQTPKLYSFTLNSRIDFSIVNDHYPQRRKAIQVFSGWTGWLMHTYFGFCSNLPYAYSNAYRCAYSINYWLNRRVGFINVSIIFNPLREKILILFIPQAGLSSQYLFFHLPNMHVHITLRHILWSSHHCPPKGSYIHKDLSP